MRIAFTIVWITFFFGLACAAEQENETEPLVLKLRSRATASGSQITFADIADLSKCNSDQRRRLEHLDLAELPLSSQPVLLSQHQIGFRLQLAGFDVHSFRLEGPSCVRVSRADGDGLDAKIAATARRALEEKMAVPKEDVSIQLAQNVSLPPLTADGADIHLEAEVRSPILPPCRVAVEVGIYIRGARRSGVLVYLDVKKLQPVPVAVRRIEVGEAFGVDNVRLERMTVENAQRVVASEGLMGKHARRVLAVGRPIEPEDVETDTSGALVVHTSDLVSLIAKVGHLQVKTRGEAIQSGRVGQLIQVRNLDSKTTVTGRVVDHSTVEVEY